MSITEAYAAVIADLEVDSENWEPEAIKEIIGSLKFRKWELENIWALRDNPDGALLVMSRIPPKSKRGKP